MNAATAPDARAAQAERAPRIDADAPLSPDELEARLRAIGAERYHDKHPFHILLHGGRLGRAQVQAWALNRFEYQRCIPLKDAALLARIEDPQLRRVWRQRIVDHDGEREGEGGIARWLRLTDALGLDRELVESGRALLPATRFAVQAYLQFVRERSLLEAIASSLTELFAPAIIGQRVAGMLANYDFVSRDALAYFDSRLQQASQDADFALDYVKRHAATRAQQESVLAALRFKCDVLWSMLDALHLAYVEPRLVPPGAFHPGQARP
ncbi:coenzyme PQQ biosynthesis protein C [Lysobacter enzymogenes]|uniref:Pyrroloquinoline-quinone synthase n=1 Tax=Lysobacter enzymogenes TaxID=69 RepID=A0A0S2DL95_LYSEN|nr:pyrroloquinoline-quinone synthase PqqC [Lysobacter enzymogenes]ALN59101.1 coenzyme PQQ biosynthesis protein C [Lysobacter enzymogenes]QCW27331.1 pyrroloquinoline-quinone synthase PqqC [Lysobacter enzymogenes]